MPYLQRSRKHDRVGWAMRLFYALQEKATRGMAKRALLLIYGGNAFNRQRMKGTELHVERVVESGDGNILRHPQPRLLTIGDRADGDKVVGGNNGGRRSLKCEKLASRVYSAFNVILTWQDHSLVHDQTPLDHTKAEVAEPLLRSRGQFRTGDIGDAFMAKTAEMIEQKPDALGVVGADIIERSTRRAPVDVNAGRSVFQKLHKPWSEALRHQNNAIDMTIQKRLDDSLLFCRILVGVAQEYGVIIRRDHLVDTLHDLRKDRVRDIGDHDPNGGGSLGSERPGNGRGSIAKTVRRLLDKQATFGIDIAFSGQGARYGGAG